MKLMIVDDNLMLRELWRDLFAPLGITIVGESGNVADAIDNIERCSPDALLLDFHLPDGTGLDVMAAMKHRWSAIPVIIATAASSPDIRRLCLSAGAKACFEKPMDFSEISRTIVELRDQQVTRVSHLLS